jgi:hypothetical protein
MVCIKGVHRFVRHCGDEFSNGRVILASLIAAASLCPNEQFLIRLLLRGRRSSRSLTCLQCRFDHSPLSFGEETDKTEAAIAIEVTHRGSWRGISMEPGGKGSFQAVKLQRPARTTVCSHSTRDITAIGSIEFKHDNDDTQDGCLSSCGQLKSGSENERPAGGGGGLLRASASGHACRSHGRAEIRIALRRSRATLPRNNLAQTSGDLVTFPTRCSRVLTGSSEVIHLVSSRTRKRAVNGTVRDGAIHRRRSDSDHLLRMRGAQLGNK